MQHRADVEGDPLAKSPAVGEDLDEALQPGGGVEGGEAMAERWPVGVGGGEAELFERDAQRCGDKHGFVVVDFGEQIHVVGEAGDETVRDHRCSAGEGERACLRQPEGRTGDQDLQGIERHGSGSRAR